MLQSEPGVSLWKKISGRSTRDIVAIVLECDIVVSEFELQSRCYAYFQD